MTQDKRLWHTTIIHLFLICGLRMVLLLYAILFWRCHCYILQHFNESVLHFTFFKCYQTLGAAPILNTKSLLYLIAMCAVYLCTGQYLHQTIHSSLQGIQIQMNWYVVQNILQRSMCIHMLHLVPMLFALQWNPSKADNLVPRNLSIIAGCPLWRGFAD